MFKYLLNEILAKVYLRVRQIIDKELIEMILYGSYARGDFDQESDIDVAVIVNNSRINIKKYRRELIALMSDLSLEYDIVLDITCIPLSDFEKYKDVLPYYRNINNEGVRIVA